MAFVPEGDRSARVLGQPLAEAPDHLCLIPLDAIQSNGQPEDETDRAIVLDQLTQMLDVLLGDVADLPGLDGNSYRLVGVADGNTQPFGAEVQAEQRARGRDRG